MRFKFSIDSDWHVTVTSSELGDAWKHERSLRRAGGATGRFPLPPEQEMPAAGEPHAALCAGDLKALEKAQQDIVQRRSDTSESYGRYLFDTLVGSDLWQVMAEEVAKRPPEPGATVRILELALCWSADQGDLHRLPWELMRRADGFLAAAPEPRVAVTRMIAAPAAVPGAPPKMPPAPLEMPPRVLFVIGSAYTDPAIRPGLEILGLVRDLRSGNRVIFPRVLDGASPKKLRAMMASFRPQVVHFICHGDVDAGRGFLQLKTDEQGQDPRRFADAILSDLDVDGVLPQAVVLSACQTGTMLQGQQSAPLAARLVEGGIPVVVGMAGRVSDLACRLFTRRFGETLLKGEPLVRATSQARRVAFADRTPATIDWVYPAVFLAEHVPGDFAPVPPATNDEQVPSQVWIDRYQVERLQHPVFCGRQEFFDAYEQLFAIQGARPVLAAFGDSAKSGKSRLILELTAQALRDGHVPVVIADDVPTWEPPRTTGAFITALVDAILSAYRAFSLDPPASLLLQELEPFDRSNPRLPKSLAPYLKDKTRATAIVIQLVLQEDLGQLVRAARAKHPAIARAKGLPILMLDAIDKYDKDLLNDLFNGKVLGTDGFGPIKAEPGDTERDRRIPAVLTFDLSGPALEILKGVVEGGSRKWLSILKLGPFRDDGEDLLAYERVLLHPFNKTLLEKFSDRPHVVVDGAAESVVERVQMDLRAGLRGQPAVLSQTIFFVLARMATTLGYLQPADDDKILSKEGL
jgi:hypothetical protein